MAVLRSAAENPARSRRIGALSLRPPTAEVQEWTALIALISVAIGVLALVPFLPGPLRMFALFVFLSTGPGLAIQCVLRLPVAAALAAMAPTGIATVCITTSALAWVDLWVPGWALVFVMLLCTAAVVLGMTDGKLPRVEFVLPRLRLNPPLAVIVLSALAWLVLLPQMRHVRTSFYGALFVGPGPVLAVATVAIVASTVWAILTFRYRTAIAGIAATIFVERVTVSLVVDLPIYAWTYKHIGIADFIGTHHELTPRTVDIYGSWPAMFTMTAWLHDASGVDLTTLANWWAPGIHVLMALSIAGLARVCGLGMRATLMAVLGAELANWVGQDYFSPQSIAFVMAVGMLGLLVVSPKAPQAGYLAVLLFCGIVPTHQLTPGWLVAVACALAVGRKVRPLWVPIPLIVILGVYILLRIDVVAQYGGVFSGFDPFGNAKSAVQAPGSKAYHFNRTVLPLVGVMLFGTAGMIALNRMLRRRAWWTVASLAFGSIVLFGGQSYGGEAIYRVFLYAVPGCMIIIAPVLVRAFARPINRGWRRTVAALGAGLWLLYLTLACLQGYYALWFANLVHPSQLQVAERLSHTVNPNARFIGFSDSGLPVRVTGEYVRFAEFNKTFDTTIRWYYPDFWTIDPRGFKATLGALAGSSSGDTYVVFSRQAAYEVEYFGYIAPSDYSAFVRSVETSAEWQVVAQTPDVVVVKYVGARS